MKAHRHITYLFFSAIFTFGALAASAYNIDTQQEQDGKRKTHQFTIAPDSEMEDHQEETYLTDDQPSLEEERESTQVSEKSKQEAVEDDSVSKYNFIFYFLYKFKYDTEETP